MCSYSTIQPYQNNFKKMSHHGVENKANHLIKLPERWKDLISLWQQIACNSSTKAAVKAAKQPVSKAAANKHY